VVEFLNEPQKLSLWGRAIPKGVILGWRSRHRAKR